MKKNIWFSDDFLSHHNHSEIPTKHPESPKFSIVMPSFNQVTFIERSILSVLNQNYSNVQLIAIDGGSTDGTVDIIKKYSTHIDYWISEKDAGQSDALNKGFAKADGEIFGWLNSDDLYLPNALHNAAAAFQAYPENEVVFGDWLSIDTDDKPTDLHHAFDFNLNHFKYEGFHLNAQSMFWRSHLHKRFSGFDVDLYNTMDFQMILEFGLIAGSNKFLRIPNTLGAFRRYDGQKTAGFSPRVLNEHKNMAARYGYTEKYGRLGKLLRLPYRVRRAYWYLKRGGIATLASRVSKSIQNARQKNPI